jgi:tRNA-binding EMAP/Myf-like protein
MLYDIENLLKEAKLSEKEKTKIIAELKEEFPQDEMLFELHLFRIVQYLKKQKMKESVNSTI